RDVKIGLRSPPTTSYRIMKALGPQSGKLEPILSPSWWQSSSGEMCSSGISEMPISNGQTKGRERSANIKRFTAFQAKQVPNDLMAGWRRANKDNCILTTI